MNPSERVDVKPTDLPGWYQIQVYFNDGKIFHNGVEQQHDRRYGFGVQASDEIEAKIVLRSHLLRCVDVLNAGLMALGK